MNEMNDIQKPPRKDPGRALPPSPSEGGSGGRTGVRMIISGIMSALGLGQDRTDGSGGQPGDVSTRLAQQRTDMAMDRNYMAAERTLMAWIRTALSMISFGFTIGKLGQVISAVEVNSRILGRTRMMSVESIAYFLVILGTIALLMASIQHRVRMYQLYQMGLRRQVSTSFVVAVLLIVVGGFALSSLVMAL
jgi:putative membrane protein